MRFMGGIFSDYDNQIVRDVINKMQEGYDFEKNIDALSPQERYTYIGICTGINTVVTMAEHTLEEKSAEVLNAIFGTDVFEWNDGSEESDVLEDIENGTIDKETFEEVMAEAVMQNVINEVEKTEE